jgi:hypothetical protein
MVGLIAVLGSEITGLIILVVIAAACVGAVVSGFLSAIVAALFDLPREGRPVSAIRIRKTLDSDTLHLPELRPLIGRTVEITVEEQPPAVRNEFYNEAARLPETEEAFEAQKAVFRAWRSDRRFAPYWTVRDGLIARDFATARKWCAMRSQLPVQDYDFDALDAQEACDLGDTRRRMS